MKHDTRHCSGPTNPGKVGATGKHIMDLQKIKVLIDFAAETGLAELEFEENGCRLRIARAQTPTEARAASAAPARTAAPAAAAAPVLAPPSTPAAPSAFLKAPMFGMFCLTPAPNEAAFVRVGDTVHKGQKLCMLEAMKQFHALNADRDGKIVAILADNGAEVDAGQPLFEFE